MESIAAQIGAKIGEAARKYFFPSQLTREERVLVNDPGAKEIWRWQGLEIAIALVMLIPAVAVVGWLLTELSFRIAGIDSSAIHVLNVHPYVYLAIGFVPALILSGRIASLFMKIILRKRHALYRLALDDRYETDHRRLSRFVHYAYLPLAFVIYLPIATSSVQFLDNEITINRIGTLGVSRYEYSEVAKVSANASDSITIRFTDGVVWTTKHYPAFPDTRECSEVVALVNSKVKAAKSHTQ